MKRAPRRNLQLDVLRGVAILLVFGRHLDLPRPEGVVGTFAQVWYRVGWLGVDLFFVLSGFLIGGLLVTELQQHGRINVARFLVRRGLKLYPGYFVFIAYLILMPTAKAFVRGDDAWGAFSGLWALCWPNLVFLQNYLWTPAGHTWSLAVEEHFYLVLPFVLVVLAKSGRIHWLIRLCLIAVPVFLALRGLSLWADDRFAETMSASHLRLEALLFGVGVRAIAQYLPHRFQAARHWRPALVGAGILLWLPNLFLEPSSGFIRTIGLTATFVGSAGFLVATYHTRAADFGRLIWCVAPTARLVGWIGFHSYAIYLWHVTTFGLLEREIERRVTTLGGTTQLAWLVSVLFVCAGAVLVGVVASKAVEAPVLRLRDRFFPSRSAALPVGPGTDQQRVEPNLALARGSTGLRDGEAV